MSDGLHKAPVTSMAEIETNFATGQWAHDRPEHVRLQLLAESAKRTEAMVFEDFFQRTVLRTSAAHPQNVSFGWITGFYFDQLEYWFRIETKTDRWNDCDDVFAAALQAKKLITITPKDKPPFSVGVKVFRASLTSSGTFRFCKRLPDGTFDAPVEQLGFREHQKIRAADCIRDSEGQDFTRQSRAIDLLEWMNEGCMGPLSVKRRLMNSVLPGFGISAIDLDALVLDAATGRLAYVEFKRKFPAKTTGLFGLDRAHAAVAALMRKIPVASLHPILVSPVWTDGTSPLGWYLNTAEYGHRWAWVLATLANAGSGTEMTTHGAKSGHHGGVRTQSSIGWSDCRLLSRGLVIDGHALEHLRHFLATGDFSLLPETDYESLRAMTDGMP